MCAFAKHARCPNDRPPCMRACSKLSTSGPQHAGWGNNELQIYQEANAQVVNGALIMTANYDGKEYTSARMRTIGLADFTPNGATPNGIRVAANILMPEGAPCMVSLLVCQACHARDQSMPVAATSCPPPPRHHARLADPSDLRARQQGLLGG